MLAGCETCGDSDRRGEAEAEATGWRSPSSMLRNMNLRPINQEVQRLI